jgi:hypothetical protein
MLEQPDGMTWEAWEVFLLNLNRRRRRRRGVPGSAGGSPSISAPILSLVSVVGFDVTLQAEVDDTVGEGDTLRRQFQAAGGDWSSLVSDTTHPITAPEDAANEVDYGTTLGAPGDFEARANVTDGAVTSNWSNTVSFTVAATSNNLIFGAGNNLLWSTDHLTWA